MTRRIPRYQLHRASGQARVRLAGRDVYLGPWGSPESKARYDQVIADWLAGQHRPSPSQPPVTSAALTVNEVLALFLQHAQRVHQKNGEVTDQVAVYRSAFRPVAAECGPDAAITFGPRSLKRCRERMAGLGWTRGFVNTCVACVRRAFEWAVGEELLPGTVSHALRAVKGLRKGTAGVRESKKVVPPPWHLVERTLPLLQPTVRDLLTVQHLAGMRPGEAAALRPCDVHRDGQVPGGPRFPGVWVYVVTDAANKNAHHDQARLVFLGPKAQDLLAPYLARRKPDQYLFSPAESRRDWHARRTGQRRTPLYPSHQANNARRRKGNAARQPGDRYDARALQHAVARACRRAFPPPAHLKRRRGESEAAWRTRLGPRGLAELAAWREAHHWHPNQLRHARASELRASGGLDVAGAVLGHAQLETTLIYAERNLASAAEAMRRVG